MLYIISHCFRHRGGPNILPGHYSHKKRKSKVWKVQKLASVRWKHPSKGCMAQSESHPYSQSHFQWFQPKSNLIYRCQGCGNLAKGGRDMLLTRTGTTLELSNTIRKNMDPFLFSLWTSGVGSGRGGGGVGVTRGRWLLWLDRFQDLCRHRSASQNTLAYIHIHTDAHKYWENTDTWKHKRWLHVGLLKQFLQMCCCSSEVLPNIHMVPSLSNDQSVSLTKCAFSLLIHYLSNRFLKGQWRENSG